MDSERDQFLRAIAEHCDNDRTPLPDNYLTLYRYGAVPKHIHRDRFPYTVYADWCEEQGEEQRAELIRLSCAHFDWLDRDPCYIREKGSRYCWQSGREIRKEEWCDECRRLDGIWVRREVLMLERYKAIPGMWRDVSVGPPGGFIEAFGVHRQTPHGLLTAIHCSLIGLARLLTRPMPELREEPVRTALVHSIEGIHRRDLLGIHFRLDRLPWLRQIVIPDIVTFAHPMAADLIARFAGCFTVDRVADVRRDEPSRWVVIELSEPRSHR